MGRLSTLLALLFASPAAASSLRGGSGPHVASSDASQHERPHRGNRHLFTFSGTCTDADYAETPYYVSPIGNNWSMANGWGLSPAQPFATIQHAVNNRGACQTIYVMEGVYRNSDYGLSNNHNNKVVTLNGVADLKILADPTAATRPVLEFDGPGGILGGSPSSPLSNIEISGLEIRGPSASISYAEAMADRLIKNTRYTGKGVAIWAGHHIYIHDMKVHHCPGSGMRVNRGDYVTIADSEVYSNTWWTSSAESAIVLAEGANVDDSDSIKMRLVNNVVYDNVNKIPFYNPNLAWDYSPIGGEDCSSHPACEQQLVEGCPWQCRYGKITQDYIIDGSGVYVTRNEDTYLRGQMELADNVAYGNGINGVVFHRTNRGVVQRNTCHDNGVVPRLEHPEPIVEDWHVDLRKSRQPYSGIVINNAEGVELWSNNVAARYDDDYAFNIVADGALPPLAAGGNNQVCKGLVNANLESVVSEATDPAVCGLPPVTPAPSKNPTRSPSTSPSRAPSTFPTVSPTGTPSSLPTGSPSSQPTGSPSKEPTTAPTHVPTPSPTNNPTTVPTDSPTSSPTTSPTLPKDGWCSDNTGRCSATDLSDCICHSQRMLAEGSKMEERVKLDGEFFGQRKLADCSSYTTKDTCPAGHGCLWGGKGKEKSCNPNPDAASPTNSPTNLPTKSPTAPVPCECLSTAFPTSSPTQPMTNAPTSTPTRLPTASPVGCVPGSAEKGDSCSCNAECSSDNCKPSGRCGAK